jgi:hypothetical protein
MHGTSDQIDDQEQKNGAEPPGMVHVEEVEKVQDFIQADPVSLGIFCACGILDDHRADDGEDGEQNEQRNRKLERPEKVIENCKKSAFFRFNRFVRFFHNVLLVNV